MTSRDLKACAKSEYDFKWLCSDFPDDRIDRSLTGRKMLFGKKEAIQVSFL